MKERGGAGGDDEEMSGDSNLRGGLNKRTGGGGNGRKGFTPHVPFNSTHTVKMKGKIAPIINRSATSLFYKVSFLSRKLKKMVENCLFAFEDYFNWFQLSWLLLHPPTSH